MRQLPFFIMIILLYVALMCTYKPDNQVALPKVTPFVHPVERFKGATLHILCWEGYADPSFTKAFEEKYHCTVKATYFGNQDEMVEQLSLNNGYQYDVVSPSCDFANHLILTDAVIPLDTSKITYWSKIYPMLRDMEDIRKGGSVYGMPFTWGPDFLIYDADVITEIPRSWRVLWDPQYKGKVSVPDDIVNVFTTGIMLGFAKTDDHVLYNMTDAQLATCKFELTQLNTNLHHYWATSNELSTMFLNKEVVIALGWPLTVNTLQQSGRNIKAVLPLEGATGWIDRLMILKTSKNVDLAHAWLDYISTPEVMAKVAAVTTYSVSNPDAQFYMSEALRKNTFAGNETYYFGKLSWWQWTPNRKKYQAVLNEVKYVTR